MDIKAKKSLGQNFLNNDKILNDIANSVETKENDLIIEIGPGKGALTKYLSKKNSFLICYEVDTRMNTILNNYNNDKTKIIFNDFLKANIEEDIKEMNYNNLYIIANIPYYITTPIIKKAITFKKLQAMTLLVQKEVAERLSAKPGNKAYGSLTVYLNYYFNIDYLFDVNKNCFTPSPKVDSAVIKFTRKNEMPQVKDENKLFQLIENSFKLKRKTLKNNLKEYNWNKINEILIKHNLPESIRAEELSLDLFIEIVNHL